MPDPADVLNEKIHQVEADIAQATEVRFPYPLDALPGLLRNVVLEYSAFGKVPIPMIACSALSALSLVFQGKYNVMTPWGSRPVSLFTLVLADSGERKSSTDRHIAGPLREWLDNKRLSMESLVRSAEAKQEIWAATEDRLKAQMRATGKRGESADFASLEDQYKAHLEDQPESVYEPRLFVSDASIEGLGTVLEQTPSAALWSAEAGILFGSYGMREDKLINFLGILNDLWDGNDFSNSRSKAKQVVLRGVRLTASLMVQPAVYDKFIGDSRGLPRGNGFLARFLLCRPESRMGERTITLDELYADRSFPHLNTLGRILSATLDQPITRDRYGRVEVTLLGMTSEAQEEWMGIYNQIERDHAPGGQWEKMTDFASKSAENICRVAALFALVEGQSVIDHVTVRRAGRVVLWHLTEARLIMTGVALSEVQQLAMTMLLWAMKSPDGFKRRDAQRLVPSRKLQKNRDIFDEVMKMLVDAGILFQDQNNFSFAGKAYDRTTIEKFKSYLIDSVALKPVEHDVRQAYDRYDKIFDPDGFVVPVVPVVHVAYDEQKTNSVNNLAYDNVACRTVVRNTDDVKTEKQKEKGEKHGKQN